MRLNRTAGFSPQDYCRIGGKSGPTKSKIAVLTNDGSKRATRGDLFIAEKHLCRVITGSLSILMQKRNLL